MATKSKLTKEELEQVKDLAHEIQNQDLEGQKWGTAKPLVFLLQSQVEEQESVNDPEYYVYYDSDAAESYRGQTPEEILKNINTPLTETEREELLITIEYEMFGAKLAYQTQHSFLTYKAAERHLISFAR